MRKLPKENMKNILVITGDKSFKTVINADFINGKFFYKDTEDLITEKIWTWKTIAEDTMDICELFEGQEVFITTQSSKNKYKIINSFPYNNKPLTEEIFAIHGEFLFNSFGLFVANKKWLRKIFKHFPKLIFSKNRDEHFTL